MPQLLFGRFTKHYNQITGILYGRPIAESNKPRVSNLKIQNSSEFFAASKPFRLRSKRRCVLLMPEKPGGRPILLRFCAYRSDISAPEAKWFAKCFDPFRNFL
jgi:hypothetical protein